ncbi:putative prolyl 4-hydroxylase 10 [Prunus yedoensis var. nudiflora]|uniref:Putative prolyl 4-hydroxylase 10 n=1 Tax=Prunus yedoensis var. nudiflora TaxID=2094558 RepID=A0A314Z9N1_PRUYE|nr:putative prolyl 4-hydroxylase 10 [Prunus yedoensis var. nudiflora]
MAVKPRHARLQTRKTSSSSSTLVLTLLVMFTFAILILLALGILSVPSGSSGNSAKANDLSSIVRKSADRNEEEGAGEQWVEVISWEPRAFVYHNFLTKEECEYLIDLAKPSMHKSTVVDSETGKSKDSRVRTSSGTFLQRGRDKIIRNIEKRIANFTFLPVEHGEGLQVLHYEVGQKYEPHYDYFQDEFNTGNGGQHGDALLFWSMRPDASLDPSSLHGGCPVIKGNKWSSTKWVRVNELYEFLCCSTCQHLKPELQYLCIKSHL